MLISSSGDSNFNKSKIYSEWRISILYIIYIYIYIYLIYIYQAVEIRTSTNLWVCSECRISITNIILNTNYWNSVGIKQWRFEPKWNYISLEWRISITTISLLYIHIIYAYIKQWRFELRTPLPKRGAQPLGHLPDKFEK